MFAKLSAFLLVLARVLSLSAQSGANQSSLSATSSASRAIIVPTASDIALGLQFTGDFIVDSEGATNCYYPAGVGGIDANGVALEAMARLPRCRFRRVSNLNDIDQFGAVSLFHKQMIACIANGSQKGTPTISPKRQGHGESIAYNQL